MLPSPPNDLFKYDEVDQYTLMADSVTSACTYTDLLKQIEDLRSRLSEQKKMMDTLCSTANQLAEEISPHKQENEDIRVPFNPIKRRRLIGVDETDQNLPPTQTHAAKQHKAVDDIRIRIVGGDNIKICKPPNPSQNSNDSLTKKCPVVLSGKCPTDETFKVPFTKKNKRASQDWGNKIDNTTPQLTDYKYDESKKLRSDNLSANLPYETKRPTSQPRPEFPMYFGVNESERNGSFSEPEPDCYQTIFTKSVPREGNVTREGSTHKVSTLPSAYSSQKEPKKSL